MSRTPNNEAEMATVYKTFAEASESLILGYSDSIVFGSEDESEDIEHVFAELNDISDMSQLDVELSSHEIKTIAAIAISDVAGLDTLPADTDKFYKGDGRLVIEDALRGNWYEPPLKAEWELN